MSVVEKHCLNKPEKSNVLDAERVFQFTLVPEVFLEPREIGNTEGTRGYQVAIGPFCNCQFDAFDSCRMHKSEIQVQGNQRFFSSRCFATRLRRFAALSRLRVVSISFSFQKANPDVEMWN